MKHWYSYIIDLVIVIVGVSAAFWLSQVADDKKEAEIRDNYLTEIQADLKRDLRLLDYCIEFNEAKIERTFERAGLFADARTNAQEIFEGAMEIGNYQYFSPEDFTYQSMIASGDFKLIDNQDIKNRLIRLHSQYQLINQLQINFTQALDDNYFPFLIQNVDYTTFTPVNDDFHNSLTLKNFFMYTVNDLGSHVSSYKSAKRTGAKLDSLIEVALYK
ncbi:MAG: hypothetical protein RIF33_00685 [Cyclobacteriaceae bacterium]